MAGHRARALADHAAEVRELGWTVLPSQLPEHELGPLRAACDRALAAVDAHLARGGTLAMTVIAEHYRAARCLYCWDESLARALELPVLAELAELTLGRHRLWDCEVLAALPAAAERSTITTWHRDNVPERDRGRYLWCFLCLDDVGPANGATWILPRSHRDAAIPAPAPGDDPVGTSGAVQTRAAAGAIIALDPSTLHSGGHNRSAGPRRLLNLGLCSVERPPLFDHWAIAGPRLRAGASARLRSLLDSGVPDLPGSWDVLPPGWPSAHGASGSTAKVATTPSATR
jgi:hypothetical protein